MLLHKNLQIHLAVESINEMLSSWPLPRCISRQHAKGAVCHSQCVSLPSRRLEKTTRTSPHHIAKHRPTGSEIPPPYATQSSRFGSGLPSVDDDVDVWCYATLEEKRRWQWL